MDKLLEWLVAGGIIALVLFVIAGNKETDTKIKRVYTRLDEVKDGVDKKHVSKEVCSIIHKQIGDDVREIKSDVKKLLSK